MIESTWNSFYICYKRQNFSMVFCLWNKEFIIGVRVKVLINGEYLDWISGVRGLWQDCPILHSFLYYVLSI